MTVINDIKILIGFEMRKSLIDDSIWKWYL